MFQLNKINRELILTKKTYGAVIKAGIGYDLKQGKKREIPVYTVIKVIDFNFATKKIVIECVKGSEFYNAEVSINFITENCEVTTPDANQDINSMVIKHITHNVLDKETASFIATMVLTYLVGLLLGTFI